MMRSMFAGVSGLKNHMILMDAISNNIANVNTIGFKAGQVNFQDMLSQTVRGASAATENLGGIDPIQIGLGVQLGSVTNNFTQGSLQVTGKLTDLSIQGEGFFILSGTSGSKNYTRAGNFSFDSQGRFINPANGYVVQGWMANSSGVIDTNTTIGSISVPIGKGVLPPKASTEIEYRGNLPAGAAVSDTVLTSIEVRDSEGAAHTVGLTFTKTAANAWSWAASGPAGIAGSGTVSFGTNGLLTGSTGGPITFSPTGAAAVSITPDFGTAGLSTSITQFSSASTVSATYQDGYASGDLQTLSIGNDGVISGMYSNGLNRNLAQIATCSFNNPSGLIKTGDNMYQVSNSSGEPLIGVSGTGNRGTITAGTLEMSNVDLSQEFTNMIVAQRGFQANSRTIATADQMLSDLVNIRR